MVVLPCLLSQTCECEMGLSVSLSVHNIQKQREKPGTQRGFREIQFELSAVRGLHMNGYQAANTEEQFSSGMTSRQWIMNAYRREMVMAVN